MMGVVLSCLVVEGCLEFVGDKGVLVINNLNLPLLILTLPYTLHLTTPTVLELLRRPILHQRRVPLLPDAVQPSTSSRALLLLTFLLFVETEYLARAFASFSGHSAAATDRVRCCVTIRGNIFVATFIGRRSFSGARG